MALAPLSVCVGAALVLTYRVEMQLEKAQKIVLSDLYRSTHMHIVYTNIRSSVQMSGAVLLFYVRVVITISAIKTVFCIEGKCSNVAFSEISFFPAFTRTFFPLVVGE